MLKRAECAVLAKNNYPINMGGPLEKTLKFGNVEKQLQIKGF